MNVTDALNNAVKALFPDDDIDDPNLCDERKAVIGAFMHQFLKEYEAQLDVQDSYNAILQAQQMAQLAAQQRLVTLRTESAVRAEDVATRQARFDTMIRVLSGLE